MKKKIFFIASRWGCLEVLLLNSAFEISQLWVLKDSALHSKLLNQNISYHIFTLNDKKEILAHIQECDFDIFISSGCPFIIPISLVKKKHQLFINSHPTLLPYLKGKSGINGVFYNKMKYFGATTHYMDDGIDTGKIIVQKKIDLSSDLDIGLVYYICFQLEKDCFSETLFLLSKNNFNIPGEKQIGKGSYFNRTEELMTIDFGKHNTDQILLKVKSFGLQSQGAKCQINGDRYLIFDAEIITNNYLLNAFSKAYPGQIILRYDSRFLLKTLDGIIKIKSYKEFPVNGV